MSKIEEVYKRLIEWTKALENSITDTSEYPDLDLENNPRLQSILSIVKSEVELPDNCPSRASLAMMEIRSIEKKLDEANAAFKDLEKTIWEEGS